MNTPPNALELFESSVNESLYSCFCLLVCLFFVAVFCLDFLFCFCFCFLLCSFVLYFTNRKEEKWHMEKGSEF